VIIFKSRDEAAARRWYESKDYQAVLPLRLDATTDGWGGFVTGTGD